LGYKSDADYFLYADPVRRILPREKSLYKLISGLHSSISVHIASDYLLDEAKNLVIFFFRSLQNYLFASITFWIHYY